MKKLSYLNLIIILTLVLGACSTSNNVVNNHSISKRKYTKGFHFNKKSKLKASKDEVATNNYHIQSEEVVVSNSESKTISVQSEVREVSTSNNVSDRFKGDDEFVSSELDSPSQRNNSVDQESMDVEAAESNESMISDVETENSSDSEKNELSKKKNNNSGGGSDLIFVLAIIFAIIIPPLGVAIYTNIDWMKVLIALLLTLLFFLPGIIYALLVVFDVIG